MSLRIDPKTKFLLEFVARVRGQSITTVVERSIREAAGNVVIYGNDDPNGRNWADFWDPEEGVRTLKLFRDPAYPTIYAEDELKEFTEKHWQFFYTTEKMVFPHKGYIEILWPNISKYLDIWRNEKQSNYWAAGEAMKADLAAARVATPETWPPRPASKKRVSDDFRADLDDEIPF